MRFKTIQVLAAVLVIASLGACVKPKLKRLNPELAIPLANGRLGVADVLARLDSSELVEVNQSGLMALVYSGEIFRLRAADLFTFPNASASETVFSPITLLPANFPSGQQQSFSGSEAINLSLNGFQAQRLIAKGGNVRISVTSNFSNDVALELNFPNATRSGAVLGTSISIPSNNSTPKTETRVISLADYQVNFGPNNEIAFDYEVTITSRGNGVNPSNNLQISFAFEDVEYREFAFNPIAQSFDIPADSIDLKIFKNTSSLSELLDFGFFNPSVRFEIENGFFAESEILINDLSVLNEETGVQDPILLQGFPNPLPIKKPADAFSTAFTRDSITKDNSNINDILTPVDKQVRYDLAFNLKNSGNTAAISNTSALAVNAKVNLPLTGFAKGWTLSDTLNINADISADEIESGSLRVSIRNQFPISADLQVYFLSSSDQVLDSLLEDGNQIIPNGAINPSTGRADVAEDVIDIVLDRPAIENLAKSEKIFFRATVSTAGANTQPPTQISIYKEYFIELGFGLKAKFKDVLNGGSEE